MEVFQIKQPLLTRIMYILAISIGPIGGIIMMAGGAILVGFITVVLWTAFFGSGGLLMIRQDFDIEISPQGVSRKLWGWESRNIEWESVVKVQFTLIRNMYTGKLDRGIRIMHKVNIKSQTKLKTAFTFFDNHFRNRERLIELMNCYCQKYDIPIIRNRGAKKFEPYEKL